MSLSLLSLFLRRKSGTHHLQLIHAQWMTSLSWFCKFRLGRSCTIVTLQARPTSGFFVFRGDFNARKEAVSCRIKLALALWHVSPLISKFQILSQLLRFLIMRVVADSHADFNNKQLRGTNDEKYENWACFFRPARALACHISWRNFTSQDD